VERAAKKEKKEENKEDAESAADPDVESPAAGDRDQSPYLSVDPDDLVAESTKLYHGQPVKTYSREKQLEITAKYYGFKEKKYDFGGEKYVHSEGSAAENNGSNLNLGLLINDTGLNFLKFMFRCYYKCYLQYDAFLYSECISVF
jgi:hypothetical protein